MLGSAAPDLFSLEKRRLHVDIAAACQHQQRGLQEDDQALQSDAGEMRDTGHKFEH